LLSLLNFSGIGDNYGESRTMDCNEGYILISLGAIVGFIEMTTTC
jgi:hypothetical protein